MPATQTNEPVTSTSKSMPAAEEATRDPRPLKLDAEEMEERIAPGIQLNRCETFIGEE